MGLLSSLFPKRNRPEPSPAPEAPAVAVALQADIPEVAAEETASLPTSAPAEPDVTAQTRAQAEELIRSVVQELPDYLTVAVVEQVSGRILAGRWAGHSGGAVEVALANAEIVRQTQLGIEALQLGLTEQLQDILITLQHQVHLLQVLPQQQWLLYLAVHTQDTNLGLARAVLRSHAA
ncbi:hypothetical protein GO988_06030 [Hymenobacter sp. HMF4947]|uniref:Roadblock/LC7 domain-containing protein n=1 Tax=Hymenobacter ginkgonis TaxID=2682976 RepID=A0A7K1TBT7_9BACT|nr:hypothetical protein [Hymenobacter ginkgonis]MVN75880.1 hypothetical protein [Hymenobacter ginkgonis]